MNEDASKQSTELTPLSPETKPEKKQNVPRRKSRIVQLAGIAGLIIVLIVVWYLFGSKPNRAANRQRAEVVPVEIATATQSDVPIQIKSIGSVESISAVAVHSQVEGTLEGVHFTPGQEVKQGDLLFTIDPRPLQAMVAQANANLAKAIAAVDQGKQVLAKDQAAATNARTIMKRDLILVEQGVVSREEYDNAVAASQGADATVKADQSAVDSLNAAAKAEQANVRNAQVQLSYSSIRAPIGGKTGNLVVTTGNLVRANDTSPMVTITQSSPIYVTFTVPEPDFLRIREYASHADFRAEVSLPGSSQPAQQGRLSLIDNTVDTSTGTIRLKATFENSDRLLYPGLFTNVVLTLGTQQQAVVVPSQAVQIGQDNSFVYAVKSDMTVEVRNVKTGPTFNEMIVIDDGLKPGDKVVTDGQLRLVPGATVQAKDQQRNGPQRTSGSSSQSSGAGYR